MKIARAAGVAICLSALGLTWSVAHQTLGNHWLRGLAASLEANEVRNDVAPSEDKNWRAVAATRACDTEALYSGLVVVLRKLDQLNISQNRKEWVIGMAGGERFLSHMMTCVPSDGNAPLRLAMVKRAIAENPAEICALLKRSQDSAPNEALLMSGRIRLYGRLNNKTLEVCNTVVRRDIRTALSRGRKVDFEDVLANLDPALRSIAVSEFAELGDAEKNWAMREYREIRLADSGY